jgi:hypothetical protein
MAPTGILATLKGYYTGKEGQSTHPHFQFRYLNATFQSSKTYIYLSFYYVMSLISSSFYPLCSTLSSDSASSYMWEKLTHITSVEQVLPPINETTATGLLVSIYNYAIFRGGWLSIYRSSIPSSMSPHSTSHLPLGRPPSCPVMLNQSFKGAYQPSP